jgi:aminotransferase EvaB
MVPLFSLKDKISSEYEEISAAIKDVLSSGMVILGKEVKKFEENFSKYLGIHHCISVANGTDAIELSLKAVGVKQGDHVATTANAGGYTTLALSSLGANPFFMDVNKSTYNTTLEEVKKALDYGVRAVVITHLYGLAVDSIQEIAKLCQQKEIPLLEDCAQAHGAKIHDKYVGTFGDIASFSFYPTKNLGALGDGGAAVTNNSKLAETLYELRQYGWKDKYFIRTPGGRNSRLDELQAAFLSIFLEKLEDGNKKRQYIAQQYNSRINHPSVILPAFKIPNYVAHLYIIRTPWRDQLKKHLKSLQIGTDIHYPCPDHRQPIFREQFKNLRLENTEQICGEILTLPCYPNLSQEDVSKVIDAVNSWKPAI